MPRTRLAVLPALLALAACKPDKTDDTGLSEEPESFALGEVRDLETVDGGVQATFEQPGTYILVLFSAADDEGTRYAYGPDYGAEARTTPPDPVPDRYRLPERPAAGGGAAVPPPDSTRTFTVYDGSSYVNVEAEFVTLTDELVIWRDTTTDNPMGDIDEEVLDGVVSYFEDLVLPRERAIWGEEPDVDDSGRIDVLLSYTVNEYGAIAYVSWCDIAELDGCRGSGNGGETIYMSYPDPESNYSTDTAIVEIWAHEINHLIYAWHKYVLNDQLDARENVYLTEGMSELAQDLTGFNNGNQYIWAAAIDMSEYYGDEDYSIQGVSINDFLRGDGYYDLSRDGPLRGGAYLFLRYLFEQAGGMSIEDDGTQVDEGGMAFLQDWITVPELGPDCVETLTGRTVEDVAFDWYTALVVTGRDLNDDPVYNYQPRVQDPITKFEYGIDPYATIHGWLTLNGPVVQPIDEADGRIRAGGVEYLQVTVDEPGQVVSVPADPDAELRVRAFRIE